MSPDDFLELKQYRTFKPFRIDVAGVADYDINQPDEICISKHCLAIGIRRDSRNEFIDEFAFVRISDVRGTSDMQSTYSGV